MKKLLLVIIAFLSTTCIFAKDAALNIQISNSANKNYYLCLDSIGCLNIAGAKNRSFAIPSGYDMGNLEKIVLMDGNNFQIYEQNSPNSCNVVLDKHHALTISGSVSRIGGRPYIANLQCRLAAK